MFLDSRSAPSSRLKLIGMQPIHPSLTSSKSEILSAIFEIRSHQQETTGALAIIHEEKRAHFRWLQAQQCSSPQLDCRHGRFRLCLGSGPFFQGKLVEVSTCLDGVVDVQCLADLLR